MNTTIFPSRVTIFPQDLTLSNDFFFAIALSLSHSFSFHPAGGFLRCVALAGEAGVDGVVAMERERERRERVFVFCVRKDLLYKLAEKGKGKKKIEQKKKKIY